MADEEKDDAPRVFMYHKLNRGQKVPIEICTCERCENEFYVPAASEEWKPHFCPFCGVEFSGEITKESD